MTDRTTLALAACTGLSDAELAERGASAFARMITRKRQYATAARTMTAVSKKLLTENAELAKQLAQAQATIKALQELDAPITDTTEAAGLLAGLSKGASQ